ncbi:7TM-DISM domain-containing protein [Enterovibrio sp. Hal110]
MKFQSLVTNKILWIASTLFVVVLFVAAGVRYINFFPTLTSQGKDLSVAYSYFIDSSNSHVLSYVRKAAIFRNIEDPKEIPWQLGKKSYWIKLEVDNLLSEHRHMSLYFDTPMIDKLSIYQFNVEGQETQQWSLGDSSERDYRMGDMPPAIHFSSMASNTPPYTCRFIPPVFL